MIARRRFFLRLCGAFAATFVPAVARADAKPKHRRGTADTTPSPTPDPAAADSSAKKNAVAQLRLWKANDLPDRPIQIRLLLPGKPDSAAISPLKIEADSYQFSNYVEVPAGPVVAEVSAPERTTVLLPLHFADGGQSTLLVRAQGTTLTADWINDTPPLVDGGCDFRVFNLLPTIGDVQIDLGTILTVHISSTRSSLRLSGIKRAFYPIVINGYDGNGKNFRWNTEADFRQYRRATLLIYPDAYGRIRPRINTA